MKSQSFAVAALLVLSGCDQPAAEPQSTQAAFEQNCRNQSETDVYGTSNIAYLVCSELQASSANTAINSEEAYHAFAEDIQAIVESKMLENDPRFASMQGRVRFIRTAFEMVDLPVFWQSEYGEDLSASGLDSLSREIERSAVATINRQRDGVQDASDAPATTE